MHQTRRQFCRTVGATLAAVACSDNEPSAPLVFDGPRLHVRPSRPTTTITPGLYRLRTGTTESLLLVPGNYIPGARVPLVVALHGAGASEQEPINFLTPYAELHGFLILSPQSVGGTWDGVEGNYSIDVATIDGALRLAFERCAIDFNRICLEGFSDGASYALGLGISNPEVFRRIVAFSPGFVPDPQPQATKPEIFISHGTRDGVLAIDTSSRVIVPQLRADGYDVTYLEFDGTHTVPSNIAAAAVGFIMAP